MKYKTIGFGVILNFILFIFGYWVGYFRIDLVLWIYGLPFVLGAVLKTVHYRRPFMTKAIRALPNILEKNGWMHSKEIIFELRDNIPYGANVRWTHGVVGNLIRVLKITGFDIEKKVMDGKHYYRLNRG